MHRALFFIFTALIASGCRPAAAPIAVGNKPVSINDRPTTNLPMAPTKPLTEMSWTDPNDRVHKISDMKGKAVILDFWATYCAPCREAIPHLNSLVAKYGEENLLIVGLNVGGEEDRLKIPQFTATTRIDYPIAYPEDALTNFIFAERSEIPQTAIFNRNGEMIAKLVGYNETIKKELDAAVEKALSPQ
jgi:cytochrome c biogenesis protein CcmG/thiol:disulfide interchange protein DsbE